MMSELAGKLSAAVHLCTDMQRLFTAEGPWPTPWMERVLPQVVRLAACAPPRTVFTRFVPPMTAEEMPGMWRAYYRKWSKVTRSVITDSLLDLVPPLGEFVPPAKLFDKMIYSAFGDGRLHPFLRERGVDTVILSGSETDVCVLASALAAVDLGYRVVVAKDAVCSSADESHDALMRLYQSRFDVQIDLADVEEIVDSWKPFLR